MKKYRILAFLFSIVIMIWGILFFLRPHPDFVKHASFMASMDVDFGISRDFSNNKLLLKEHLTLLPHIRQQYVPFSYSIPSDLHERVALLQQPSNNLNQLRKDAKETQERLASFLHDFQITHRNVRLFVPEVKPLHTIKRLLVTRWEGDASRITDYARATIAFPKAEEMYSGLEEIKTSGLMILEIQDHFQTPCLGGYRDITIVFRDFVNGHVGEIQLNTVPIMDFKSGLGTALFHVIRELMAVPTLENRSLSESEKICLETLFSIEKRGYDRAAQDKRLNQAQKKVAIYSGSFDPPTKAHKEIILAALKQGQFDHLIVYVNRFGKKQYCALVEDRKKMLAIMLEDYRDKVSITEQFQKDKRTDFRKLSGLDSQLTLIIGEDSYQKRLSLPPVQLAECDKLLIVPRRDDSPILRDKTRTDLDVLSLKNMTSISSTAAREKLIQGKLPENELESVVLNYIVAKDLYSKGETDACEKR